MHPPGARKPALRIAWLFQVGEKYFLIFLWLWRRKSHLSRLIGLNSQPRDGILMTVAPKALGVGGLAELSPLGTWDQVLPPSCPQVPFCLALEWLGDGNVGFEAVSAAFLLFFFFFFSPAPKSKGQ